MLVAFDTSTTIRLHLLHCPPPRSEKKRQLKNAHLGSHGHVISCKATMKEVIVAVFLLYLFGEGTGGICIFLALG